MEEFISIFTNSETPFLILFVVLFWFYLRESKSREERMETKLHKTNEAIEEKIEEIRNDQKIMLTIWKILIEEELERRKQDGIIRRGSNSK